MKKKILLFSAMLVFAVTSAFATVPDSLTTLLDARTDIRANVSYPDFAIENDIQGTVYLRLEIMSDGKIDIIEAHSPNNELLRNVVDQVAVMNFDPTIYQTGIPFNMKFEFKLY